MAAEPSVARLTAADEPEWDAFVAGHPGALAYYSLRYRNLLRDVVPGVPDYWLAREAGRVAGVLPLFRAGGPFGDVLNALPFFGSHGGALAANAAAESALARQFAALAAGAAAATWIDHPDRPGPEGVLPRDAGDDRIGQMTSLAGFEDPDDRAPAVLDASVRRNFNAAARAGVSVAAEPDAFAFLERTHRDNMAAIGGRAKPPAFFAAVPARLREGADYDLYVARIGGEPVAALLLLYGGRTVEYFVPATVAAFRTAQPSAAILRAAMRVAARRGFTRWNWGGTWRSQDGVYRFKHKWGAVERPYRYHVAIGDRRVLGATRAALERAYPHYYVVPYALLEDRGQ